MSDGGSLSPSSRLIDSANPHPHPLSVQYLRDINDFFGVKFKVAPVSDSAATADDESVTEPEEAQDENGDVVMQFMNNKEKKENQQRRMTPQEFMVSCLGVGYSNINKSIT